MLAPAGQGKRLPEAVDDTVALHCGLGVGVALRRLRHPNGLVRSCFTCGRGDLSRALRFSTDLSSFDSFVIMFANTFKLQDECDIIALRIAKF